MANHIALPEGCVLCGKYKIVQVIGQGGFGITYLAEDMMSHTKVAMKEYLPTSIITRLKDHRVVPVSPENDNAFQYGKQRFLEEAKTLSQLSGNRNIVKIYSYFEENNTAYFIMEYIEGINLRKYLFQRGKRIDWREMLFILVPIMDTLADVHKSGIIHRDITLENIILQKNRVPILLDFGAARYSVGDRTRSLDVVLKFGYAPKEQYSRRGKQGPYTDVYSLGACMYFLITGRKPPESIDRMDEDELIYPSTLGINIPDYVEDAIVKALAVDAKDRFQSMEELKAAIFHPNDPRLNQSQFENNELTQSEVYLAGNAYTVPSVDFSNIPQGKEITAIELMGEKQPLSRSRAGEDVGTTGTKHKTSSNSVTPRSVTPSKSAEEEQKKKKVLSTVVIPIAASAFVLIMGIVAFFLLTTKVPYATGTTLEKAKIRLRNASLAEGKITYEYNDSLEKDIVIRVDKAGKRVWNNKEINIVVSKGKTPVTLEDYSGKKQDEAVAVLEDNKLNPKITPEYSNKVEAGLVISQKPEKDEIVYHGDEVTLVISQGKEPKTLPDYKNKKAETVKKEIEKKLGLKVKIVKKNSEKVEEGKVMSQEPAAKSTVYYGDPLTLTVSKGPKTYKVPALYDKTTSQAQEALEKQNLVLGEVKHDYSSSVEEGRVIDQGIEPGQMRKKGTTVSITISLGRKPVSSSSSGSSNSSSKKKKNNPKSNKDGNVDGEFWFSD